MRVDLWISILLAVPLAVLANLLTPRIRDWLDRRAQRTAAQRRRRTVEQARSEIARLHTELERLSTFTSDPHQYHCFLLEILIRATLYGAMAGLYAGLLFATASWLGIGDFWNLAGNLQGYIYTAGQIVSLIGFTMVFRTCWQGLSVIRRVADFPMQKQIMEAVIAVYEHQIAEAPRAG